MLLAIRKGGVPAKDAADGAQGFRLCPSWWTGGNWSWQLWAGLAAWVSHQLEIPQGQRLQMLWVT